MFRKTQSPQLDLFESPGNLMGKRASKKYDAPKAWHNQFYELVTTKVKEENFAPLYKDSGKGAPTASIRILASVNMLKEGFGWCRATKYQPSSRQGHQDCYTSRTI